MISLADVLVIGGGLAARWCAAEAAGRRNDVLQVGFGFAAGPRPGRFDRMSPVPRPDPAELSAQIVRSSDWGADQSVVRQLAEALPAADANPQNPSFDKGAPGWAEIERWERVEVLELVCDGERCWGAIVRMGHPGEVRAILAKATVLASGGATQLSGPGSRKLSPHERSGAALAFLRGVPMGNPEALQFHPTTLVPSGFALSDALLRRGGRILDRELHPFLEQIEPELRERAPRDVVARGMAQRLSQGGGVPSRFGPHLWLDLRGLVDTSSGSLWERVRRTCNALTGLDPTRDLLPIRPAPHSALGGVRVNRDGHAYRMRGLFALGEDACWDLHGFNRHGGLGAVAAIAEGCLVGRRVAVFAARESLGVELQLASRSIAEVNRQIESWRTRSRSGPTCSEIERTIHRTLREQVGILRDENALMRAARTLRTQLELVDRTAADVGVGSAYRLRGLARLAHATAVAALARTESRGVHHRVDHPQRDDARWLVRTLVHWPEEAAEPALDYEPVGRLDLEPAHRSAADAPPAPMRQTIRDYNASVDAAQRLAGARPLEETRNDAARERVA